MLGGRFGHVVRVSRFSVSFCCFSSTCYSISREREVEEVPEGGWGEKEEGWGIVCVCVWVGLDYGSVLLF